MHQNTVTASDSGIRVNSQAASENYDRAKSLLSEKVELKQFIADLKKKLNMRKKETKLRREKMAL